MVDDFEEEKPAGKKKKPGEETTFHGVTKEQAPGAPKETLLKSTEATVLVASGPEAGLMVPVGDRLTVGRDPANSLHLSDPSVSRSHLEINKSESQYLIKDLGSSNGTLLNGVDVSTNEVGIPRHASIQAGIYEIVFYDPNTAEEVQVTGAEEPEAQEGEKAEEAEEAPGEEQKLPEEEGLDESQALVKAEAEVPALAEEEEEAAELPQEEVEVGIPVIARKLKMILILLMALVGFVILLLIGRAAFKTIGPMVMTGKGKVLKPGQYEEAVIKRVYPFLEFTTEPLAARIWFNGKDLGTPRVQPFSYKETEGLEPGVEYEVKAIFKLDEIDDEVKVEQYITFSPDEQFRKVNIKGKIGVIHIKNVPSDVAMYLEYTPIGTEEPAQERVRKITEVNYKIPVFVPHGKFRLELRKEEEILYRRQFEISDEMAAKELSIKEEELSYAPIEIITEPADAEVFIDNEPLDKTPIFIDKGKIKFGKHDLKIEKEDYLTITEPLTVDLNEPIYKKYVLPVSEAGEFILRAKEAYEKGLFKQVESPMLEAMKANPTDREKAKIHFYLGMAYKELGQLDQALIHLTSAQNHKDFKMKGRLGEAWVYFLKGENKRALDMCIEVLSETSDLEVKLSAEKLFGEISPLKCAIYINTEPTGAKVYLNNNEVETKTPVIVYDLYPGKYRVTVRKPGFETQYDKFDISIGRFHSFFYKLKPLP